MFIFVSIIGYDKEYETKHDRNEMVYYIEKDNNSHGVTRHTR